MADMKADREPSEGGHEGGQRADMSKTMSEIHCTIVLLKQPKQPKQPKLLTVGGESTLQCPCNTRSCIMPQARSMMILVLLNAVPAIAA